MVRASHLRGLVSLSLLGLAFMVGCAPEDPTSANAKLGGGLKATPPASTSTGGTVDNGGGTGASPGPTASPAPTPSPSPSPSQSPSTTVVGGTDTSGDTTSFPTLPPVSQPSPTATPIGSVGLPNYLSGNPKAIAIFPSSTRAWVARTGGVAEVNDGQVSQSYSTGLSAPSLIAAEGEDIWVVDGTNLHQLTTHSQNQATEGQLSSEATHSLAAGANGLAVDATEAWVTHGSGTLTRVTVASGAVATYSVATPTAVALDATYAWVAAAPNKLYKVTRATGAVAQTFTVDSDPVAVALDSQGNVWTANRSAHTVSRLAGGSVTHFTLAGTPATLVANGSRIWVGMTSPNQASWLALDGTIEGSVALSAPPASAAADGLHRVWFCDSTSGTILTVWGQ